MKITKGLTIERLKSIKGFENVTAKEAEHILNTLKEYSQILFSVYKSLKQKKQIHSLN
jgi:uncharacterized protein YfbU (UPF0304 family)